MPRFRYSQGFALAAGDIADVYLGSIERESKTLPVAIKIARVPAADNDLLQAENLNLKTVRAAMSDPWPSTIPEVYDSFILRSGEFNLRPRVNILELFPGYISVKDIRKLSTGVDGRTLAWMWKRVLGLLSWSHNCDIVHGAMLPPHILFFPDNSFGPGRDIRKHAVRIVDWCYSVNYTRQSKLDAWIPEYASFYPPEVTLKASVGPETDLYMAAKTMIYLSGGNVDTNTFGSQIPGEIAKHFSACLNKDIFRRPNDAGGVMLEFAGILERVFGPPKFHEFIVPGL